MHYVEAKGILSAQNGMNIYRGCSHGCIYCDARSHCYQMKHAFEDIEIKKNAPQLLEKALKSKRKKCMIGTGAMSDPYMHIEEEEKLTRQCLELIDYYEFGLAIQTKSDRILRDIDLIDSINQKSKAVVQITLTTFDDDLCKILEPNVCVTSKRVEVLKECQRRGIPTVVWMTPLLPFINDSVENIMGILDYCSQTGVKGIITFGLGLTLREGDREYFYDKLDKFFPGLKDKYIKSYGNAYELPIPQEKDKYKLFVNECQRRDIMYDTDKIMEYLHEFPYDKGPVQLSLFDMKDYGK